jgi:hypothetical protein
MRVIDAGLPAADVLAAALAELEDLFP